MLIFRPHHLLKRLHAVRIDQLADSNEPAIILLFNDFDLTFDWNGLKSVASRADGIVYR